MRVEKNKQAAWPMPAATTAKASELHDNTILIYSNDHNLAADIKYRYNRNGHRVVVASEAVAALEAVDSDPRVGVVVVTIDMPDFDGLALVERMRIQNHERNLQFIGVAQRAGLTDAARAIHLHLTDLVSDGADGSQLHAALGRALANLQSARTATTFAPDVLEDARRHCMALLNTFKTLQLESGSGDVTASDTASRHMRVLRKIQQDRRLRKKFFPGGLFEDPCWDMLVDLMIQHLLGRRVSVSSLCIASGVAQTTALRRIMVLSEYGIVRRNADENDGRRIFVELTAQGVDLMARYIEEIDPAPGRLL
ncbi:MAG: response regulator [Azospirillaceae bacterium]|nr:response regulator [Azospirillaceae bacterium]